MSTVNVHVHELTRVEGHGDIVLNAENGEIVDLKWAVTEAPRFFEAMFKGRSWRDASYLGSRICGICAVAHASTSVRATEEAFGLQLSEQDLAFRQLNYHGEMLESHVLHLMFLVAPDAFNAPSVLPLAASHPEAVKMALRCKKCGNMISDVVCGRKLHPVAMTPGGWTALPSVHQMRQLKHYVDEREDDFKMMVDVLAEAIPNIPASLRDFERETEYLSLAHPEEYALYRGDIKSTDTGEVTDHRDYHSVIQERVVPHSTAKWTSSQRSSYGVGALARCNNNFDQLNDQAKAVADAVGWKPVSYKPFDYNVTQLIETIHSYYEAKRLIDELLDSGWEHQPPEVEPKAGRGVGVCEAPRGLLIHDYTYDEKGIITEANCIVPTCENHGNIEDDFRALVPGILDHPQEEIAHTLEMLVRAYDPCISCSVHMLRVRFV
ncbi:MAG: Ni/Fe hydrogenase subunit alpha [Candidatus Brocadiia bacterium]